MQIDKDNYGSSFKPFIGVVEEAFDESYVRVRVFGIHPIDRSLVPTDKLPLALVIYPVTGSQVNSGSLAHNLQTDSWVLGYWVDYPYCQQPIVIGAIQGTDYSMSTYTSQGGEFVGQGGEGEFTDASYVNETTNIPGDSNVQKVYNYVTTRLQAEGVSDTHMLASALVGVLMVESGPSINPGAVNSSSGAYGICQWLGSRKTKLFARYGRTRRLDQQLDFMWWELNGLESTAKGRWLSATNLPDAVAGMATFERAEEWQRGRINRAHANYKRRLKFAYQIYNSIRQTGQAQTAAPRPSGPV